MSLEDLKQRRQELTGNNDDEQSQDIKLEELKEKRKKLKESSDDVFDNMQTLADESNRVADVAHNSRQILDDLDAEFEKQTGLKKADFAFLFAATALQVLRIVIVNEKTKIEAAEKGKLEKELKRKQNEKFEKYKGAEQEIATEFYAPLNQIISTTGVPYDATTFVGVNTNVLKGADHRFATLAHDPIIGLVVGTSNILTNTITCVDRAMFGYMRKNSGQEPRDIPIGLPDIKTYHVVYNQKMGTKKARVDGYNRQVPVVKYLSPKIGKECPTSIMLGSAVARLEDDRDSVVAALIKQIIHIGTDMFTPCGIQIPAANLVLSNTAVEQMTKYFSFGDVVKIGASAGIAALINLIISTLHGLTYDESKYDSRELFAVKTKKIISISNTIATTSNLIWVGANVYAGDKSQIKNFDIGGLLVTIYNLTHNAEFIRKVKEEYIFGNFNKLIQGDDLQLKEIPTWD